jgi:hypothetical protein
MDKEIVKNLKISEHHHSMLKNHCKSEGLKMFKYIEKLIEENCKPKTDIYGEL